MLIERMIRHPVEPTVTIDFPDQSYVFAPLEAGGPLVAEVKNTVHVARLLEIPEGFRLPEVPCLATESISPLGNTGPKGKK